jgi:hypothetical protein
MKKLLYYLVIPCLIFNSCKKEDVDDSPCGEAKTKNIYVLGTSLFDTTGGIFNTYMDGTNRVFQWSDIVEQVCTDEHVNTTFRVALLDETTTGINARGIVNWQFFYENIAPMTKTGSDLKGSVQTGLKSAFSGLEGWYVPGVEVYFPTLGNYSADSAFMIEKVISVEVISNYRYYKE